MEDNIQNPINQNFHKFYNEYGNKHPEVYSLSEEDLFNFLKDDEEGINSLFNKYKKSFKNDKIKSVDDFKAYIGITESKKKNTDVHSESLSKDTSQSQSQSQLKSEDKEATKPVAQYNLPTIEVSPTKTKVIRDFSHDIFFGNQSQGYIDHLNNYLKNQDYDSIIEKANELSKEKPDDIYLHNLKKFAYFNKGNIRAVEAINNADLQKHKNDPYSFYMQSRVFETKALQEKDLEKQKEYFNAGYEYAKKAVDYDPNNKTYIRQARDFALAYANATGDNKDYRKYKSMLLQLNGELGSKKYTEEYANAAIIFSDKIQDFLKNMTGASAIEEGVKTLSNIPEAISNDIDRYKKEGHNNITAISLGTLDGTLKLVRGGMELLMGASAATGGMATFNIITEAIPDKETADNLKDENIMKIPAEVAANIKESVLAPISKTLSFFGLKQENLSPLLQEAVNVGNVAITIAGLHKLGALKLVNGEKKSELNSEETLSKLKDVDLNNDEGAKNIINAIQDNLYETKKVVKEADKLDHEAIDKKIIDNRDNKTVIQDPIKDIKEEHKDTFELLDEADRSNLQNVISEEEGLDLKEKLLQQKSLLLNKKLNPDREYTIEEINNTVKDIDDKVSSINNQLNINLKPLKDEKEVKKTDNDVINAKTEKTDENVEPTDGRSSTNGEKENDEKTKEETYPSDERNVTKDGGDKTPSLKIEEAQEKGKEIKDTEKTANEAIEQHKKENVDEYAADNKKEPTIEEKPLIFNEAKSKGFQEVKETTTLDQLKQMIIDKGKGTIKLDRKDVVDLLKEYTTKTKDKLKNLPSNLIETIINKVANIKTAKGLEKFIDNFDKYIKDNEFKIRVDKAIENLNTINKKIKDIEFSKENLSKVKELLSQDIFDNASKLNEKLFDEYLNVLDELVKDKPDFNKIDKFIDDYNKGEISKEEIITDSVIDKLFEKLSKNISKTIENVEGGRELIKDVAEFKKALSENKLDKLMPQEVVNILKDFININKDKLKNLPASKLSNALNNIINIKTANELEKFIDNLDKYIKNNEFKIRVDKAIENLNIINKKIEDIKFDKEGLEKIKKLLNQDIFKTASKLNEKLFDEYLNVLDELAKKNPDFSKVDKFIDDYNEGKISKGEIDTNDVINNLFEKLQSGIGEAKKKAKGGRELIKNVEEFKKELSEIGEGIKLIPQEVLNILKDYMKENKHLLKILSKNKLTSALNKAIRITTITKITTARELNKFIDDLNNKISLEILKLKRQRMSLSELKEILIDKDNNVIKLDNENIKKALNIYIKKSPNRIKKLKPSFINKIINHISNINNTSALEKYLNKFDRYIKDKEFNNIISNNNKYLQAIAKKIKEGNISKNVLTGIHHLLIHDMFRLSALIGDDLFNDYANALKDIATKKVPDYNKAIETAMNIKNKLDKLIEEDNGLYLEDFVIDETSNISNVTKNINTLLTKLDDTIKEVLYNKLLDEKDRIEAYKSFKRRTALIRNRIIKVLKESGFEFVGDKFIKKTEQDNEREGQEYKLGDKDVIIENKELLKDLFNIQNEYKFDNDVINSLGINLDNLSQIKNEFIDDIYRAITKTKPSYKNIDNIKKGLLKHEQLVFDKIIELLESKKVKDNLTLEDTVLIKAFLDDVMNNKNLNSLIAISIKDKLNKIEPKYNALDLINGIIVSNEKIQKNVLYKLFTIAKDVVKREKTTGEIERGYIYKTLFNRYATSVDKVFGTAAKGKKYYFKLINDLVGSIQTIENFENEYTKNFLTHSYEMLNKNKPELLKNEKKKNLYECKVGAIMRWIDWNKNITEEDINRLTGEYGYTRNQLLNLNHIYNDIEGKFQKQIDLTNPKKYPQKLLDYDRQVLKEISDALGKDFTSFRDLSKEEINSYVKKALNKNQYKYYTELNKLKEKIKDITGANAILQGEYYPDYEYYYPNIVLDSRSTEEYFTNIINKDFSGVKTLANSAKQRKVGLHVVDFNASNVYRKIIRENLMNFYIRDNLMGILDALKDIYNNSDKQQIRQIAKETHDAIKDNVKYSFTYEAPKGLLATVIRESNKLVRIGLYDPLRVIGEHPSNILVVGGIAVNKLKHFNPFFTSDKNIMKYLSGKEGLTFDTKFSKEELPLEPASSNLALRVIEISDKNINKRNFYLTFQETFKKLTGEEFDLNKWENDRAYRINNKEEYKKSLNEARHISLDLFPSALKMVRTKHKYMGEGNFAQLFYEWNNLMNSYNLRETSRFFYNLRDLALGTNDGRLAASEALAGLIIGNTLYGMSITARTMFWTEAGALMAKKITNDDDLKKNIDIYLKRNVDWSIMFTTKQVEDEMSGALYTLLTSYGGNLMKISGGVLLTLLNYTIGQGLSEKQMKEIHPGLYKINDFARSQLYYGAFKTDGKLTPEQALNQFMQFLGSAKNMIDLGIDVVKLSKKILGEDKNPLTPEEQKYFDLVKILNQILFLTYSYPAAGTINNLLKHADSDKIVKDLFWSVSDIEGNTTGKNVAMPKLEKIQYLKKKVISNKELSEGEKKEQINKLNNDLIKLREKLIEVNEKYPTKSKRLQ